MANGKKRVVTDEQLGALAKKHNKDGASASSVLLALRGSGIAVAGGRVRSLFKTMTGKRAPGRPKGKRQVA